MAKILNKIPKMNPTFKKIWLKALRSRKYKQGIGQLCDAKDQRKSECYPDSLNVTETKGARFCCLGVLEHCVTGKVRDGNNGILSNSLRKKVGLSSAQIKIGSGELDVGTIQEYLADKNDSGNWKFGKIANWIEKNL